MNYGQTTVPKWKEHLPLIVLSILLLGCGVLSALGYLNLPLPATDHIADMQVRWLVGGMALCGLGMGGSWLRLSFEENDRVPILSWVLMIIGVGGLLAVCIVTVDLGLHSQHVNF